MNALFRICLIVSTLSLLLVAEPARAQCSDGLESGVGGGWRQLVAPWIPNVTFELSNELGSRLETARGMREAIGTSRRDSSESGLYDGNGRTLDWQVGARWNVVEIVDSLRPGGVIPLPADDEACPERLGAPLPEYIEEEQ